MPTLLLNSYRATKERLIVHKYQMEVGEDSVFLPIFASSIVRGCPVGRRRAGRRKTKEEQKSIDQ